MMPKVLIADDEPHIRLLLGRALEPLEDEDVEILTAENGAVALDLIVQEKPDIAFLDVMMPQMSGYDVCREVKKERKMSVYVVLLTAKGQEADKKMGMEAGANLYMTKPFNPDQVLSIARKILSE
ncbi:MAG: response regulator transcription factor [Candidatus Saccharibacteria bacterium]